MSVPPVASNSAAAPVSRRISRPDWRWSFLLAFTTMACGLLLAGLSAWFLGSVAIAGLSAAALTFNFHIPAAFIRLFAIGRTVTNYEARLFGHKAALADQIGRRSDLFDAMANAPEVRAAGWQFGDPDRLADYIDDVEDLDYGRLRVDQPAVTLCVGLAAMVIATLVFVPLALPAIGALVAVATVAGHWVSGMARETTADLRTANRDATQTLGTVLAAVVPLRAENAWSDQLSAAIRRFDDADGQRLRQRRVQAAFDMLAGSIGPLSAACVILSAWVSGLRGEGLLPPAVIAFGWLALGETAQTLSRLVLASFRRRAAAVELARWTGTPGRKHIDTPLADDLPKVLAFYGLKRRAPDGRPIGAPLTARFEVGRATVLSGASGSGKTSLLKQIAGWIGVDAISVDGRVVTAETRRDLCVFCPHDAAIIADTIRANLFAPGAADDLLWQALVAMELDGRIRQAGGLDGWITQEVLSLGEAQRLNLARAWLSEKPVVLLDEPSEHLDQEQAGRLLARLLAHLDDRIVVLSSHRPVTIPGVARIELRD